MKKDIEKKTLAYLREPFADNQIGKLPKPTKAQTEEVKKDYRKGVRCEICKQWHHPKVVHLDYVGHAALTDRFLDVDPLWNWAPLAKDEIGLPAFDNSGGLWINLTILGLTRLGYGHAPDKTFSDPGSREKEVIGDALRNAGMRFGCALDLWHKGDLHVDEPVDNSKEARKKKKKEPLEIEQELVGLIDKFFELELPEAEDEALLVSEKYEKLKNFKYSKPEIKENIIKHFNDRTELYMDKEEGK